MTWPKSFIIIYKHTVRPLKKYLSIVCRKKGNILRHFNSNFKLFSKQENSAWFLLFALVCRCQMSPLLTPTRIPKRSVQCRNQEYLTLCIFVVIWITLISNLFEICAQSRHIEFYVCCQFSFEIKGVITLLTTHQIVTKERPYFLENILECSFASFQNWMIWMNYVAGIEIINGILLIAILILSSKFKQNFEITF